MILKGRTRADGGKLATYLLSSKNEQVRVLDVRGTVIDERSADGLKAALGDMDELGKMTRAKSSLFHLAINPDARDRMTPDDWKQSVDKAEKALGLEGQPRAIVSHVYEGKQHLHVVWSRVDVEERKCVEMSFSHLKLCRAAREIEIELGLKQTPARARGAHKLNQHIKDIQQQQDERSETPRETLNATVTKAWHEATTAQEFKTAIKDAGYILAMGNRYISVMNSQLENYPVQRCVEGVRIKDVREKLAGLEGLPTIDEVRQRAAQTRGSETEAQETERAKTEAAAPGDERAATSPQLIPRSAQNATAPIVGRELTADNDNPARPDTAAPTDTPEMRRQAKDWIPAPPDEKTGAGQDSAQPEKPAREYKPFKGESEAQFAARLERMKARDERGEEASRPEIHLQPRRPVFGR